MCLRLLHRSRSIREVQTTVLLSCHGNWLTIMKQVSFTLKPETRRTHCANTCTLAHVFAWRNREAQANSKQNHPKIAHYGPLALLKLDYIKLNSSIPQNNTMSLMHTCYNFSLLSKFTLKHINCSLLCAKPSLSFLQHECFSDHSWHIHDQLSNKNTKG